MVIIRWWMAMVPLWMGIEIAGIAATTPPGPYPLLGRWPESLYAGSASRLCVVSNTAYIATAEEGLVIADLSEPFRPVALSKFALPGVAVVVGVARERAYVAVDGTHGVFIVDVSDPRNPVLAGQLPDLTNVRDLVVEDGFAYFAQTSLVRIFDLADPSQPAPVGPGMPGVRIGSIDHEGDYLYMAQGLFFPQMWFDVVDVSDPAAPSLVTRLVASAGPNHVAAVAADGSDVILATPAGVEILSYGPFELHVPNFSPDGLIAVDVVGGQTLNYQLGTIVGAVQANYGVHLLGIIESEVAEYVSVPTEDPRDIHLDQGRAYVLDRRAGVQVFEWAAAPEELKLSLELLTGRVGSLDIDGSHAYLAAGSAGLQIVDVTDPAHPLRQSVVEMEDAHDVVVKHPYAYVAESGSRLHILDITDPAMPLRVGETQWPNGGSCCIPARLDVADGLAVVLSLSGSYALVNIANPAQPEPYHWVWPGSVNDVKLQGPYAFDVNRYGMNILDVRDPGTRLLVGECVTVGSGQNSPPRGLCLLGRYALIADGFAGLTVVDVGNPALPVVVANVDTPGIALRVHVFGDLALVTHDTGEVHMFTIHDPTAPEWRGTIPTVEALDLEWVGDRLYEADGVQGLNVWQWSSLDTNPPTLIEPPGDVTAHAGEHVWMIPTVTGTWPLSYQWFKDQTNVLTDATNSLLSIPLAQLPDEGGYSLRISNAFGVVTSAVAHLTLIAEPVVAKQAVGQRVTEGASASFQVEALGAAELHYQWYFNETNLLVGAHDPTLALTGVGKQDVGTYRASVSNAFGVVWSEPVLLEVLTAFMIREVGSWPELGGALGGAGEEGLLSPSEEIRHVVVQNGLAYLSRNDDGLTILDVSDACCPSEVGSLELEHPVSRTHVDEDTAYLASPQFGFFIVDVSDPSEPALRAQIPMTGGIDFTWGEAGDLWAGNIGNVYAFDVSDPAHPSLVASNRFLYMMGFQIEQHRAYMQRGARPDRVEVYDVRDITTFHLLSSHTIYQWRPEFDLAEGRIYMPDSLAVIDASDPTSLVRLTPTNYAAPRYRYVAGMGSHVLGYHSLSSEQSIQLVDLTDPMRPSMVQSLHGVETVTGPMVVQGQQVYVPTLQHGLRIFDVTTSLPQAPTFAMFPQDRTLLVGDTLSMETVVLASDPVSYQWWFDETNALPGATHPSLVLADMQTTQAGRYTLMASNLFGDISRASVDVTVQGPFELRVVGVAGGQTHLSISNIPPYAQVILEASTNLVHWVPIWTNESPSYQFDFLTPSNGPSSFHFFKAWVP